MASPDACAAELRRAREGPEVRRRDDPRHDRRPFLDHPSYDGLLAAAVELDVPIYIHPNVPTPDGAAGLLLRTCRKAPTACVATAGWGWHSEVAIHILRMVLAGTFDKHPEAQDDHRPHGRDAAGDARPHRRRVGAPTSATSSASRAATILEQVWITTSGIFSQPPFIAALQTFGIDRIMFSVDYPFAPDAQGREFLDEVALAPADMAKLSHGNADALLKLKA